MKKGGFVILTISMLFLLFACTNKSDQLKQEIGDTLNQAVLSINTIIESGTEVQEDLLLPTTLESLSGVMIVWSSSENTIINSKGKYIAPPKDMDITLKATIYYKEHFKEIRFTVKALGDKAENELDANIPLNIVNLSDAFELLNSISAQRDVLGNFTNNELFKLTVYVVETNGNNSMIVSDGFYHLLVKGTYGMTNVSLGDQVSIVGRLSFDNFVPTFKVSKSSPIEIINQDNELFSTLKMEINQIINLNELDLTNHGTKIHVEGFVDKGYLFDLNYRHSIYIGDLFDITDFDTKYVEIEANLFYDFSINTWYLIGDNTSIAELMVPCDCIE